MICMVFTFMIGLVKLAKNKLFCNHIKTKNNHKMSLFTDCNIINNIKTSTHASGGKGSDVDRLVQWLMQPPSYTTFRINKLKPGFKLESIRIILKEQGKNLNASQLPECTFIRPDCLMVKQWPKETGLPSASGTVIVDNACAAAVLRGSHVFAPGVMGMSKDLEIDSPVNICADVKGLCRKGLKVDFEGPTVFVGVGLVKQLRSQLFKDNKPQSGIAVEVVMPASRLPCINESIAEQGQVLLQNLPSMVCGWAMDPRHGESIIDMCASPGNKTTHLAELSNNEAFIVALDKTASKVDRLKKTCNTQGATSVRCYVQDSIKCCSEECQSIEDRPPYPANSFDKVLLDAPCSALGQRPQISNNISSKTLHSYAKVQKRLFCTAVQLVKPGGCLVYSTCTITEEENEGVVRWALDKFPCLELVEAQPLLGGPGWPHCGLNDRQRSLVQRFGPEEDPLRRAEDIYRDTVGFFIAKFVKK